jgi:hypothetical protein
MADINPHGAREAKEDQGLINAPPEDIPRSALSREAYMLAGGIKDGFMDRVHQARENPGLTALEFGGAVAVGAGLTAMSMAGGRWETAARIGSTGLKVLAVADGVRRAVPSLHAMGDTLVNPEHYLQNRATVAKYLGSACFDYPLMAAGGMVGSAASFYGPRAASSLAQHFRAGNGVMPSAAGLESIRLKAAAPAAEAPGLDVAPEKAAPLGVSQKAKIAAEATRNVIPENPAVSNADLQGKVIFWDNNVFEQIKSPGSQPFVHHRMLVHHENPVHLSAPPPTRSFDFKIPLPAGESVVRPVVMPVVPLPLSYRLELLRKQEK